MITKFSFSDRSCSKGFDQNFTKFISLLIHFCVLIAVFRLKMSLTPNELNGDVLKLPYKLNSIETVIWGIRILLSYACLFTLLPTGGGLFGQHHQIISCHFETI